MSEAHKHRILFVVAALLSLFWVNVLLIAYSTSVDVDETAINLPLKRTIKPVMRIFLTQGWSFFTKSPRDEEFYLFGKLPSGDWQNIFEGPSSEPKRFFGLDRFARAQGLEFGFITGKVPSDAWTSCSQESMTCLKKVKPVRVQNSSHAPLLCGEVGVVFRKPPPWAWSKLEGKFIMPSRVAVLEISC